MKTLKEEKSKLDEEIRKLHKDKAEEKELYLKLKEENIMILGDKKHLET